MRWVLRDHRVQLGRPALKDLQDPRDFKVFVVKQGPMELLVLKVRGDCWVCKVLLVQQVKRAELVRKAPLVRMVLMVRRVLLVRKVCWDCRVVLVRMVLLVQQV